MDDLLRAYRSTQRDAFVNEMVIAVAGPVHVGHAKLTNRKWTIKADKLKQDFACRRVVLLNDLGALGYAVPEFGADHVTKLCGGGSADARYNRSLTCCNSLANSGLKTICQCS